jgi:hypothetical protein
MALDATIISVATPKISTQFQALDDVGWYGASYSMLLTAFTPIASNFYKYFNPKYVYLASIVVFEGMSSKQSPICAKCTESRVLTKATRRRVHSLCCGAIFPIFHYWQSNCRYWSSWSFAGCVRHTDICLHSRETSIISRGCGESLRPLFKYWASNWRKFDRTSIMAMVFLDVSVWPYFLPDSYSSIIVMFQLVALSLQALSSHLLLQVLMRLRVSFHFLLKHESWIFQALCFLLRRFLVCS